MVQQITWQNVSAPDLSRASEIMGRASAGFQTSAAGIAENLQGVRDRQRTNRSAAAYPMLAGINSGGNVDSILGQVNAAVRPEDMTPELRDAMMAARGIGMGYDQTGASTRSVNDATGRANTEFDRAVARENQLAGMAPGLVRAQQEAYNTGNQSPGQATAGILREFEGFSSGAYYDVNAHRAGYGSDTVTRADGSVVPVTAGTTVSQEEAELDLSRRVDAEFLPRVMEQVGVAAFERMSTQQKAVLGSVAYNYGSLPRSLVEAVKTGDQQVIAQAIQDLGTDNEGINAKRRSREAELFMDSVNSNYIPDIAGMLPETGNTLLPADLMGIVDNFYGDRRTAITADRGDQAYALEKEARLKGVRDAEDAANLAADVNRRFEAMLPRLGPSSSLSDLNGLIRDQNLPPALRDAMLGAASGKFDANRGVFSDGQQGLPITSESEAVDAVMLQVASKLNNDPLTAGLIAGGVLENTDAAVTDMNAPEGMVRANTSVGSPGSSLFEQATTLMPDNPEAVESSVTDMMSGIERVYEKFGKNIPRNVIAAMARQSMSVNEGLGILDATVEFDENLLIEQLTPIGTPAAYRKYVAEQSAKIAEAQELKAANTAFETARTNLNYWENSSLNGANVNADRARKTMDEAFDKISKMGLADAAKNNAAEVGMTPTEFAESQKAAAKTAEDEVVAGKTSEANRAAIVRNEGVGTESVTAVNPESSRMGQWFERNARRDDVADAISAMRKDLAGQGAGGINSFINDFSPLRSDKESQKTSDERVAKNEAYEWLASPAATQMFLEDPKLVDKAKKDPETFYREYAGNPYRGRKYAPRGGQKISDEQKEAEAAAAQERAMNLAFTNASRYQPAR